MLKSKYLQEFKRLKENEAKFTLYSDRILVEKIPPFEAKSKSGLILHAESSQYNDHFNEMKAHFVIVLLVGKGYYDHELKETIKLEVKSGDVLMIPSHGIPWLTQFGPLVNYKRFDIGLVTESNIHFNFGSIKNFQKFFDILNEEV